MKELIVEGEDPALAIDPRADPMALLAGMVGGHQMLAPVLDPLDRAPEAHRGEDDQHIFGIELTANAEAAADMAFAEMHRGGVAPEHAGEHVPGCVRHLGGAIQLDYVGCEIITGEGPASFERNPGVTPDRQVEFDDRMRSGKRGFEIAVALADYIGFDAGHAIIGGQC